MRNIHIFHQYCTSLQDKFTLCFLKSLIFFGTTHLEWPVKSLPHTILDLWNALSARLWLGINYVLSSEWGWLVWIPLQRSFLFISLGMCTLFTFSLAAPSTLGIYVTPWWGCRTWREEERKVTWSQWDLIEDKWQRLLLWLFQADSRGFLATSQGHPSSWAYGLYVLQSPGYFFCHFS